MFFLKGNLPCWYELSLLSSKELAVRVHPDVMEHLKEVFQNLRPDIQDEHRKRYDCEFIAPITERWGISGCLWTRSLEDSDWEEIAFNLPIMKRVGMEFGKSEHNEAMRLRSSLDLLFTTLWLFGYDQRVENKKPQLMVVEGFSSSIGIGQAGINVSLSPAMVEFLKTKKEIHEIPAISAAMYQAGGHMWERDERCRLDKYYHRTTLYPPNRLHLSVDGNACGLDPSLNDSGEGCYDLVPHNVDSSLQQLSLFAGVCFLNDIARNNKKPPW